jgi:hypothetical protein
MVKLLKIMKTTEKITSEARMVLTFLLILKLVAESLNLCQREGDWLGLEGLLIDSGA